MSKPTFPKPFNYKKAKELADLNQWEFIRSLQTEVKYTLNSAGIELSKRNDYRIQTDDDGRPRKFNISAGELTEGAKTLWCTVFDDGKMIFQVVEFKKDHNSPCTWQIILGKEESSNSWQDRISIKKFEKLFPSIVEAMKIKTLEAVS